MSSDIGIRIRSSIIHIKLKSTCIRSITPITTEISNTRSIQISIIFCFLLFLFAVDFNSVGNRNHFFIAQKRREGVNIPFPFILQIHQASSDTGTRNRSSITHTKPKSTRTRSITPMTTEKSNTRSSQISIIAEVSGF